MKTDFWYGLDKIIKNEKRIFLIDTNVLLGGCRRGNPKEQNNSISDLKNHILKNPKEEGYCADALKYAVPLMEHPNIRTTRIMYEEMMQVLGNINRYTELETLKRISEEVSGYLKKRKNEMVYNIDEKELAQEKTSLEEFILERAYLEHRKMYSISPGDMSLIVESFISAGDNMPKPVDIISSDYAVALGLNIIFNNLEALPIDKKLKRRARWKCMRLYSRNDEEKDFECDFDSVQYLSSIKVRAMAS